MCRVKKESIHGETAMSTLGKRKDRETSDFHGSVMLYLSFSTERF